MPPKPFQPQRVLVIGGASGIGASLTLHIIRTSTAQVFCLDKSIDYSPSGPLGTLLSYPNRMYGHEADVTVPGEREHAVATCIRPDVLGGIDTVVYCAGVIEPIERVEKMDMGKVEGLFGVNVFGAMAVVCFFSCETVLLVNSRVVSCMLIESKGAANSPSPPPSASRSPTQRRVR